MADLLIRGATLVLTMDEGRRELAGADILCRDGVIVDLGSGLSAPGAGIDAAGCLVTPGLINTHHHLYQTLTGRCRRRRTRCCSAG